jgi:hypothetical protein
MSETTDQVTWRQAERAALEDYVEDREFTANSVAS